MLHERIKTRVVGVDINVDQTTYAVIDIRGHIIARDSFSSEDYPKINDYILKLSESILEIVEANGGYESVRSIGISAPSANQLTGCLENAPNLPWKGVVPLAAMLRDSLGIAVVLGNDAYAFALGEHAFGPAHGMKNFILVTIGSGTGSRFFSNGEPYNGNHGFSGEVGHICVEPGGRLCGCGKRGCLETYTAQKGFIQTAREVLAESELPSTLRSVDKLTVRAIAEEAVAGDELAKEVLHRTAEYLGLALANYASIINPEAIILTGDVTKGDQMLLEMVNEVFEKHVFHNMKGKVKLVLSQIDEQELNLLGASVMAWDVKEYSLFL